MNKRTWLIETERSSRSYGDFMLRLAKMASNDRSRQELEEDGRKAIERADMLMQALKDLDNECAA